MMATSPAHENEGSGSVTRAWRALYENTIGMPLALARIEGRMCPTCGSDAERHGDWMRCVQAGAVRPGFGPVEFQLRQEDRQPVVLFRHWED